MTPDEIITVLQGVKAGRKWGIRFRSSGDLVEQASQDLESLCRCIVANDVARVELMPLPDEITIPARVIPAPLREPLNDGDQYWIADVGSDNFCFATSWFGNEDDLLILKRGLAFADQQSAEKAAKAMCHYA